MKQTVVIILALLAVPLVHPDVGATDFQAAATSTTAPYTPEAAAFGDFNNDGYADLALAISNGSNHYLRILSGNGTGTLTFVVDLATASGIGGIVAADLNGDGISDLTLANTAVDSISVFLSNGDGTFQPRIDYAVGTAPKWIATGDFRGDGVSDDIAVINSGANSVTVLLNDGNGALTAQPSASWPNTADPLAALAVGDFDGDDIDDIAVARNSIGKVQLFFGSGVGTFTSGSTISVGPGPSALVAADLNSDGPDDLAVANSTDATVTIIKGNSSRALTVASTSAVTSPADNSANPLAIIANDVNRDGIHDLVVANNGTGTLSVLVGKGDGTFAAAESFPTGAAPSALAAGNLDGNGTDLLTLSTTSGTYSLLLNSSPPAAGMIVTPGSHDFGKIHVDHATYIATTIAITNGGSADLMIGSMAITGGINSPFLALPQYGSCGTTTPVIAAGSSCTIQVRFINPITEGAKTDSLVITAINAVNTPAITVPLTGTVVTSSTPYTVSIVFLGRGSGTVSFSTGDTACTTDCNRTPPENSTIVLTATPAPGSYLYGWNGCDWLYDGTCRINFSQTEASDRTVTVNHGLVPRRLMVTSTIQIYAATLLDAYNQAGNSATIKMTAGSLPETLTMDKGLDVTLSGGYDSNFTTQGTTPTFLKGIIIVAGRAVLDNIVLQ
jgi:hypothetical protein